MLAAVNKIELTAVCPDIVGIVDLELKVRWNSANGAG
jgi:hypothetical protein